MNVRHVLLALFLLGHLLPASASTDMRFKIGRTGQIDNLPRSLSPVFARASFSSGQNPRLMSFQLQTPNGQSSLPKCLLEHIESTTVRDIELTGSWHHEEVPVPYITVQFYAPKDFTEVRADGSKFRRAYGFRDVSIIFNLRTGKILATNLFVPATKFQRCTDGSMGCGPVAQPHNSRSFDLCQKNIGR